MTHPQEWHEQRRQGIGGSDIGAIMGLSKYKSPMSIYLDKLQINEVEEEQNRFIYFGTKLEPFIREEYSLVTGNKVTLEPEHLKHKEHSFMLGNIDGWIGDKEAVLECKNVGDFHRGDWGLEGTDQIPESYKAQIAWYLAITDKPYADLAAFGSGNEFRVYRYNRDKEYEQKMIEIGHDFWNNNVLKQVPPKKMSPDDIKRLYPISHKKDKILATSFEIAKIKELKKLKAYGERLKEVTSKVQMELQNSMKNKTYLVDALGNNLVSWRTSSATRRLNTVKLKKELPEIYEKYTEQSEGTRRFLLK